MNSGKDGQGDEKGIPARSTGLFSGMKVAKRRTAKEDEEEKNLPHTLVNRKLLRSIA